MQRSEISQEDAIRHLAGAVRNHMSGTGVIFSPYHEMDLTINNEQLWRVLPQGNIPLANVEDLYDMTDNEIFSVVTQERNLQQ